MMGILLAVALGVLTWSFMEYCIHRWLGHDKRFIKNLFGTEHTMHHAKGNYFAPWWKKIGAAVIVTALLAGPAVLVAGPTLGLAWVGGLVGFYLTYELIHRLLHVWEGVGPYANWARRHHFHHHFHEPGMNHGVTSPIWDVVFGTYVRPQKIRVPHKLAMTWLIDDGGEVHAHLTDRYELRRPKKKVAIPA